MKNLNKDKKDFKHTPIGWIPEDWGVVRGLELTTKITKGSSPNWQGFSYSDDGVLFVTSENVRDGYLDISKPKFLPKEFSKKQKNSILVKNDILINIVGASIGRSCIFLEELDANINQAVCLFRLKENVCHNFFLQYLQLPSTIATLLNTQTESARPNLSLEDIRGLYFPFPTYKERVSISLLLTCWDIAIDRFQRLITTKEHLKKALMQQLLTGTRRLPGFEVKWKKIRFSDAYERVNRKNTENNMNVVTVSAKRGFVRQTDFFNKTIASEILDNYFLLKKGEFVYNKSYSNGYDWGAIKRLKEFDKAVVTTLYICFRLREDSNFSADYSEHFFQAGLLNKGLTRIAPEGGRAHGLLNVTPSDFFNLYIFVPEPKEQVAIASVLSAAEKEIQLLKSQLELYRQQKKGLMQVLLTGNVRAQI